VKSDLADLAVSTLATGLHYIMALSSAKSKANLCLLTAVGRPWTCYVLLRDKRALYTPKYGRIYPLLALYFSVSNARRYAKVVYLLSSSP
jgi:hypothetical protein